MGIILALIVAGIDAINNVFVKRGTTKFDVLTMTWAWQTFSLVVLLPALFFKGVPVIHQIFYVTALSKISLYLPSLFLYAKALQLTDISLAVPMLAFSPIITLAMSFLLSKETPTLGSLFGVFLIIGGVYWMNSTQNKKGLFAPLRNIFHNKGVLCMFAVSMLWGVTSSLDKVMVTNSSPIFASAFVTIINSIVLTPVLLIKRKREFFKLFSPTTTRKLLPIGVLDGVMAITQMTALSLTLAGYVIAIKRSSIVLSSILGHAFYKEDIRSRIKPILVMFGGLVLIFLTR